MGYYLLDHPPARSQYRLPRREPLSGGVGVHTAESMIDTIDIDTGAENVAGFIAGRTDAAGSYHDIGDSDSVVEMLPDEAEAFQVSTGDNRHLLSWSFACSTTDLIPSSGWTQAAMRRAGVAIAKRWQRIGADPIASARWVSAEDAQRLRYQHERTLDGRLIGWLVNHGTLQPWDRSDAWATSPFRTDLEAMLVDAIIEAVDGPDQEDETMCGYSYRFATHVGDGGLYVVWGPIGQVANDVVHVAGPDDIAVYATLYGATPIEGAQDRLIDGCYAMQQKQKPGQGQGVTVGDLAQQTEQIKAGVAYILEMDGRSAGDARAFADEVVNAMAARLAPT